MRTGSLSCSTELLKSLALWRLLGYLRCCCPLKVRFKRRRRLSERRESGLLGHAAVAQDHVSVQHA
ncbi:uncharacterized protein SETTUDRAFT_162244 [Exserohilum turcica Et28A]|uniref:Uncharacterized protein n=1 Tax=Exserohilum turcicum (strain 28A) TaxID=671987 RepID=R0KFF4_EXST2|nr:uncharacterized protein SETTUDRAFT_162244 [Exserohilum turcica Et28A]EOA91553.1 hypothetical protein SETTUDRAFT_162244 [Exserohilum turcica Et28A]